MRGKFARSFSGGQIDRALKTKAVTTHFSGP